MENQREGIEREKGKRVTIRDMTIRGCEWREESCGSIKRGRNGRRRKRCRKDRRLRSGKKGRRGRRGWGCRGRGRREGR